ncbi:MAG: hypothetical protein E7Z94_09460 [Actinomyces ruminicola]|nr:hypothetical protein [Actinomyces ruminicola]
MSNNELTEPIEAAPVQDTDPADTKAEAPQAEETTTPLPLTSPGTASTPDESATAPLPAPATTPSSPEDTWELPGGKPPESPAPPKDAKDLPVTPERDVWSGPRRPAAAQPGAPGAAPTAPAPRGVRATTLVWGLILLVLGGLLIAVAAGLQIDLVTAVIVLLAGVGVALLITALLPRRKGGAPGAGA